MSVSFSIRIYMFGVVKVRVSVSFRCFKGRNNVFLKSQLVSSLLADCLWVSTNNTKEFLNATVK